MTKRIFLLGSSGLVGSSVYSQLLVNPEPKTLVTFTRRKLNLLDGTEVVSDLTDFSRDMQGHAADLAFCAIGTTMKKAGSQKAFEEIDYHLPIRFAKAAKEQGVKGFHLLTALGADPKSKTYYLRIKGEVEAEIQKLGFESFHVYRPSLLLGERQEFRFGEEVLAGFYRKFHNLYPEALDAYRPIEVPHLSRFIVRKLLENSPGHHVWDNKDMLLG